MKYWKYYLIAILIIGIDQSSKLLVHHYMEKGMAGEIHVIGDWFRLHYLLNPGMAFGIELDFLHDYGKLFLTIFRIIASGGIAYAIFTLYQKKAHPGLLASVALILGGAIGNVIDSVFYGVFMEGNMIRNAPYPWFHGQVIDMLYFPLFEGHFPEWLPKVGGDYFLFFSPVFNIADSAIFVGVTSIILFQKRFSISTDGSSTTKGIATEETFVQAEPQLGNSEYTPNPTVELDGEESTETLSERISQEEDPEKESSASERKQQ